MTYLENAQRAATLLHSKINQQMYIDDIKLFAKNEKY